MEQNDISLDRLVAVGSDGENKNTGINKSIIRQLEEHLNRPLQWIICLLHANELSLRALFTHIDGLTSGPSKFSGKIGKETKVKISLPLLTLSL